MEISTAPGSEPDQVILVVDLVEKSTGEFSVGAGYSTGGETSGPSVEGSITERNFLGRGQYIRFSAGGGRNSRDYHAVLHRALFPRAAHCRRFRHLPADPPTIRNYDSDTNGATVRFGLPITEALSTQLAYNLLAGRV